MIENDKQYEVTKSRLAEFESALIQTEALQDIDPLLKKLYTESIKSQIETFKQEIAAFEKPSIVYRKDECPFKYCEAPDICKQTDTCRYK